MIVAYIFAKRESIPRLPGEDQIYIRCQVGYTVPIYEEAFRVDANENISKELLAESTLVKARELIKQRIAAIEFEKKSTLDGQDRKTLLEFLKE